METNNITYGPSGNPCGIPKLPALVRQRFCRPLISIMLTCFFLVGITLSGITLLCITGLADVGMAQEQRAQNTINPRQNSTNPHGELSAGLSCDLCHTPEGWVPAKEPLDFDHNTQTLFPLTGAHISVSCESCHLNLQFREPVITGDGCASCHVDVHQGAFLDSCTDCHNQTRFTETDIGFIHQRSDFPLIGAHSQIACESCHANQDAGHFGIDTGTACIDCHEQDYLMAESIDHVASGFSTTCEDCHSMLVWSGVNFEHTEVSGGFALLGAHDAIRCESCHLLPSYDLTFQPPPVGEEDCYACHADDYEEEHAGSGFPTDCTLCHNVNDWDDARFEQHDQLYFPIFSGEHQGEWNDDCSTCHVVANDFSVFSCIDCHEHNQPDMDDEHDGVNGYIYESESCYSCHPNGSEEDAEGGGNDD